MKTPPILVLILCGLLLYSCGTGNRDSRMPPDVKERAERDVIAQTIAEGKGIGEITEVNLEPELNPEMVKMGKSIYDMKCSSCHRLNEQRVVGPGFAGVTNRRRPEWIMNMITNVEVMLEKDPTAQLLLEQCLTRMPNQNVSVGDARNILEFMRSNDFEKTGEMDGAAG